MAKFSDEKMGGDIKVIPLLLASLITILICALLITNYVILNEGGKTDKHNIDIDSFYYNISLNWAYPLRNYDDHIGKHAEIKGTRSEIRRQRKYLYDFVSKHYGRPKRYYRSHNFQSCTQEDKYGTCKYVIEAPNGILLWDHKKVERRSYWLYIYYFPAPYDIEIYPDSSI